MILINTDIFQLNQIIILLSHIKVNNLVKQLLTMFPKKRKKWHLTFFVSLDFFVETLDLYHTGARKHSVSSQLSWLFPFLHALFILDRLRGGEKVDRFWTFVPMSAACHRSEKKVILIKKLFIRNIFWQMTLVGITALQLMIYWPL